MRCRIKYDEESIDETKLLRRIYNHLYEMNRIDHPKRPPTTIERIHLERLNIPVTRINGRKGMWLRWNKPEHQQFKLNTDGSRKGGVSAGGGIVRNRQGDFVCGFTMPYGFDDVILAELQAVYDGIWLCVLQMGLQLW